LLQFRVKVGGYSVYKLIMFCDIGDCGKLNLTGLTKSNIGIKFKPNKFIDFLTLFLY